MNSRGIEFHRPIAFWTGAAAITAGVVMHLPDFISAGDMAYHMADMPMGTLMIAGMVLIVAGMALATWGLLPPKGRQPAGRAEHYHLAAIDDAVLTSAHWRLLFVLGVALIIDVMKPATLGFVLPGMAKEYGIPPSRIAWLLIFALAGTTVGSLWWGMMADRLGRRSAILLASLMFIGTAICGTMPSFALNLLMCFLMGLAAGGMLPIVYALMAESVPATSRGWLVVLHGGMGTVGGTLAAAGCAALLEPMFSWRALWLMNLPTGLIMLVLNRWIPESPRFLLNHGRVDEARAVMGQYGVRIEALPPGRPQPVATAPSTGSHGLRALFRAPFNVQTWVVLTYGLAWGILNWGFLSFLPTFLRGAGFGARTASLLLLFSALTAIPGTLIVAWAYGVWSSRKSMVVFAVASVASALGLAWLSPDEHTSRLAIVAMLGLLYAATGGMIAMLSPYSAEVFPTALRGTGSGLSAGSSKLGGLVGALATVTGLLTISSGMAAPGILVSLPVAAAAGLVAWRGRETRGRRLEEVGAREVA